MSHADQFYDKNKGRYCEREQVGVSSGIVTSGDVTF